MHYVKCCVNVWLCHDQNFRTLTCVVTCVLQHKLTWSELCMDIIVVRLYMSLSSTGWVCPEIYLCLLWTFELSGRNCSLIAWLHLLNMFGDIALTMSMESLEQNAISLWKALNVSYRATFSLICSSMHWFYYWLPFDGTQVFSKLPHRRRRLMH